MSCGSSGPSVSGSPASTSSSSVTRSRAVAGNSYSRVSLVSYEIVSSREPRLRLTRTADPSANLARLWIFVLLARLGQPSEQMPGLDLLGVLDQDASLERQLILVAVDFLRRQTQTAQLAVGEHVDAPVDLGDQRLPLRRTSPRTTRPRAADRR